MGHFTEAFVATKPDESGLFPVTRSHFYVISLIFLDKCYS